MIHVDLIRQNTAAPDRRRRHQGRASCQVDGRRYAAEGPAPIYKLVTLIWLHGYGGQEFEVHDNCSPRGGPGGLAMRGVVRNYARVKEGRADFRLHTKVAPEFSSVEAQIVASAASWMSDIAQVSRVRSGFGHTERSRLSSAGR